MLRTIITIDEEKCNGCGLCVEACHEGAIVMVDGKAKLLRDDYCDGLGNCLPACPTNAISFEEREAAAFDEEAVKIHMMKKQQQQQNAAASPAPAGGCPGRNAHAIRREPATVQAAAPSSARPLESRLQQWPVQIKLVPVNAPYLDGANLLIAADCTAFAYADFHEQFMRNRITLIGCPKLDEGDYADKLTAILQQNDIQSLTVVRMEVPCCGGIVQAVRHALERSGKIIPWQIVTISTDGRRLEA